MQSSLFERINSSRRWLLAVCGLLFLYMLLLNCLTPYAVDDFSYRLSFYDQTPIRSVSDIFTSMYHHAFSMNGRVIAHFFEQLFMLTPKLVFNICNALVYVALMLLLYRIANYHMPRNLLLFAVICGTFWQYMPAFGQVALWQVGSVNYLWALLGMALYLSPFLAHFTGRKNPPRLA